MRVGSYTTGAFDTREVLGGAGEVELREVFGSEDFETPFDFIKSGRLQPGVSVGLHVHPNSDELLVVLDEPITVVNENAAVVVESPAAVLRRAGSAHGIYNQGAAAASFFLVGVAPKGAPFEVEQLGDDLTTQDIQGSAMPSVEALDRSALASGHNAHLGAGEIRFRRLFGPPRDRSIYPDQVGKTEFSTDADALFSTNLGFVDHAELPPGNSVGYHRHDTMEECQIIIGGRALMKVDGEVVEVSTGDCIPNRLGGSHGLINHTDAPVEFMAVAVSLDKNKFDFTNLNDDLRSVL
jgi:uncharacterized cupin superfamily protein